MGIVRQVEIKGLRNILHAQLSDIGSFNVIQGDNGAGKTALLEAIHMLGMARSFRINQAQPLINHSRDSLELCGDVRSRPDSDVKSIVSLIKTRSGEAEISVHGRRCTRAAELAELLPLQLINHEAFMLLEGSPGDRRRYLDWGVFHVEHEFLGDWKRARRLIKQRNSLLRHGKMRSSELDSWDEQLVALVDAITDRRRDYLESLLRILGPRLTRLWPELSQAINVAFYPGWDQKSSFRDVLYRQRGSDLERGFTQSGFHRADLKVTLDGLAVGEILSRGQLKILAAAMKIAQVEMLRSAASRNCVVLVDDLPAELDLKRRSLLLEALHDLQVQVFVTCISGGDLPIYSVPQKQNLHLFHVEHGNVSQL